MTEEIPSPKDVFDYMLGVMYGSMALSRMATKAKETGADLTEEQIAAIIKLERSICGIGSLLKGLNTFDEAIIRFHELVICGNETVARYKEKRVGIYSELVEEALTDSLFVAKRVRSWINSYKLNLKTNRDQILQYIQDAIPFVEKIIESMEIQRQPSPNILEAVRIVGTYYRGEERTHEERPPTSF